MQTSHFLPPHACKILWVNPIGFDGYDKPIGDLLATIKNPATEIELVSLNMAATPTHLENRTYEALIIGDMVRLARYASQHDFDAMIIGCFYDPALEDAREISGNTVIVAPCQASVQIMANLCNRFSVIVGQQSWVDQMEGRIRHYGYDHQLVSMRPLGLRVDEFQHDTACTEQRILDEARAAVEEDHAEGLILGCTIEFGFFQEVQKAVGVPVIDAVFASFKQAEYLGGLARQFGWNPSRRWSCTPPAEAELEQFGVFKDPPPIGNKITYPAG